MQFVNWPIYAKRHKKKKQPALAGPTLQHCSIFRKYDFSIILLSSVNIDNQISFEKKIIV